MTVAEKTRGAQGRQESAWLGPGRGAQEEMTQAGAGRMRPGLMTHLCPLRPFQVLPHVSLDPNPQSSSLA